MRAGKAEYTSAAIKRAAVHVWIAAKAATITIFFILELHHANVRYGSIAALFDKFSRMSAFGRMAVIECLVGRHKKPRHEAGFLLSGSGGAFTRKRAFICRAVPIG